MKEHLQRYTALHLAARKGCETTCALLLRARAEVSTLGRDNSSALTISRSPECSALLAARMKEREQQLHGKNRGKYVFRMDLMDVDSGGALAA